MPSFTVDPIRKFELKGNIATVVTNSANLTAGLNQVIVAASTGYRIRVMGWSSQTISAAAVGYYRFKDGNGGSVITQYLWAPITTVGQSDKFPITDSGYFETTSGNGLYADSTTADICLLVHYIIYAP